ncbi:MAG: alanine dehydrogenase [Pseudomonadota bacterium]
MDIGVPTEIKNQEKRVGLLPMAVKELRRHGHEILVQAGAGTGVGASDDDYRAAGAKIADDAAAVYANSTMIVKVKEPQSSEYALLRDTHILFTYLHLAADKELTKALIDSGTTAVAYETITAPDGGLPLLKPMSEVAGRMSIQAGAFALQASKGGQGILLGGAAGVAAGEVLIIGGGVVGTNAAKMALGLGARVTIADKSLERLVALDDSFGGRLNTVYATADAIGEWSERADMVIGAVLVPGAAAPKLITRPMLRGMKPGAVLVDVAIDQGGCFETSRATTHDDPTYLVDGIVHYCVANMPGGVPKTSTYALNNATLPYIEKLASADFGTLISHDPHITAGLNVRHGQVTHPAVAAAFETDCVDPGQTLRAA